MTDPLAVHGEGPVWDHRQGQLLWVDMLRGDLLRTALGGGSERQHVASVAACVAPRDSGGCVLATERGFVLLDAAGQPAVLPDVWQDISVRMNDGAVDATGRFWCGSMAYDAGEGRGSLYRLDPDGTVDCILKNDVTISNGLGWSPDGTIAYYIDTPTRQVDRCAPDLSSRSVLVTIADEAGMPDGLTVDAEGGVWVALWGGSAVHRYSPEGVLDAIVELPVSQVTSCAFGGDDLRTLLITTSAQGLADPEPGAGALYACQPGVQGLPTHYFAG